MLGDKPDSQDGGAPKVLVVAIIVVMVTIVIVNIISTNGERAKRCQKSLKNSWHKLNINILKSGHLIRRVCIKNRSRLFLEEEDQRWVQYC